jgi:hypothetical protein
MVISGGRQDLEDPFAHVQDRNVEGASAEVEDEDLVLSFLVDAIGQTRRRRLVDDAHHL